MKIAYSPLKITTNSHNQGQLSPKKEQWALINQYKALQFERLKQHERLMAQQKKLNFRRQLDNQMNSKNNVQYQQVQADKRYYQYITQKANEQKQKYERQKYSKIIQRRQIQQDNNKALQMTRSSRITNQDTGYHLDIGHKSQLERKINTQNIKKVVIDSLDQQLKQKIEDRQRTKNYQMETDIKNLNYQYNLYDNRRFNKSFGQNQKVYQYYQNLDRQKKMRDFQLQSKIVDEAAQRKKYLDDQRIQRQQMKRHSIQEDVKETLDLQVKAHNLKRLQDSKINPQQFSYGVIGGIFRQRQAFYDKQKYTQQLRRQAQQQRKKKQMQKYMSAEEYRLNLNQLNKIVNGQFAHNSYLDRSMGTIGDRQVHMADIAQSIRDKDADVIKNRINYLRQNNASDIFSKKRDHSS